VGQRPTAVSDKNKSRSGQDLRDGRELRPAGRPAPLRRRGPQVHCREQQKHAI